jgi:hypothetical protein
MVQRINLLPIREWFKAITGAEKRKQGSFFGYVDQ